MTILEILDFGEITYFQTTNKNIDKEIAGNLPRIQGDFVLLQDAFFNLIDNAVDALARKRKAIGDKKLAGLPNYQGKVTVRMYSADSHIITQIQDDGIGIKEDEKKDVFVPFFTSKATVSKGTGLGLFVIQKIILEHQGEISLTSEYGQGTTFTVKLPLKPKGEKNGA